ncbi:ABC transporter ATP-binding protein [Thiotrichales bacterium 19S11-10]|nr:ABC transporter ATP-binding protein [Thiotrichales bacterium 19S11-10]
MLSISKLSVSVDSKKILNNISLDVGTHQILAVIGPNGAGKSTLLKSILSLYDYSGQVLFNDENVKAMPIPLKSQFIAYLGQSLTLSLNLLAKDVVLLGAYAYRKKISKKQLNELARYVMKLTDVIHLVNQDYFSLSAGEKQRVQLARSLLQLNFINDGRKKLLLLDEHVSHLDLKHQHQILSLIRKFSRLYQLTIVMVLHDLNLVLEYSDLALVINHGEKVDFGVTEKTVSEQMVQEVYQMRYVSVAGYKQGIFLPSSVCD